MTKKLRHVRTKAHREFAEAISHYSLGPQHFPRPGVCFYGGELKASWMPTEGPEISFDIVRRVPNSAAVHPQNVTQTMSYFGVISHWRLYGSKQKVEKPSLNHEHVAAAKDLIRWDEDRDALGVVRRKFMTKSSMKKTIALADEPRRFARQEDELFPNRGQNSSN